MTNQKLQGIREPREQIPQKKENKGRFLERNRNKA